MEQKEKMIIRSKNKSDMVVEKMLEYIADGRYRVGDSLPTENELCEQFGVSRVTIRESLKQLSVLGIVDIRQGGGTYLNRITPDSVINLLYPLLLIESNDQIELFEARICIEKGIAQLAAKNRTQDDINIMEKLIAEMEECVKTKNPFRYNDLDNLFHNAIALASKNQVLINIYTMLGKVRERNIRNVNTSVELIADSLQGHKNLLNAIVYQDEVNIDALMCVHLRYSKIVNEGLYGYVKREWA
jgi:GntR family transcriptional repressor for pyruvate dehydrogenase complex